MREYKFRGKRLDNGELAFGFGAFIWEDDGFKKADIYSTYGIFEVDPKREVSLCQDGYFTVDTFPLRKWEEGEWDIEYEVIEDPELLEVPHG